MLLSDSFRAFLNNIETAPHSASVGLAFGVYGGVDVLRTASINARCLIKVKMCNFNILILLLAKPLCSV